MIFKTELAECGLEVRGTKGGILENEEAPMFLSKRRLAKIIVKLTEINTSQKKL